MFEIIAKMVLSLIERELRNAAPAIQREILDALDSLIETLSEFLGVRHARLAKGLCATDDSQDKE